jgi:hypothetical protein
MRLHRRRQSKRPNRANGSERGADGVKEASEQERARFGQWLQIVRLSHDLTLNELAALLFETWQRMGHEWRPFDARWVSAVEHGDVAKLSVDDFECLIRALHADSFERALLEEAWGRHGWDHLVNRGLLIMLSRCQHLQRVLGKQRPTVAELEAYLGVLNPEISIFWDALAPRKVQALRGSALVRLMDEMAALDLDDRDAAAKLGVMKVIARAWTCDIIRAVSERLHGAGEDDDAANDMAEHDDDDRDDD